MKLDKAYDRQEFVDFLRDFLPDDFKCVPERVTLENTDKKVIKSCDFLGESPSLNLSIYEFEHESEADPRVTVTKEIFKFMRDNAKDDVLAIVKSKNSQNYRLSLVTEDFVLSDKGVKEQRSNPRRYSFVLGPEAKVKTPEQFLILKGKVKNFEDLQERFSIEIVNKEFYRKISDFFNDLVDPVLPDDLGLVLPDDLRKEQKQNFVVRLIGRTIFCWFLKKKKSNGKPLISDEILSKSAVQKSDNYFHFVLENLFFQVLNTPIEDRKLESDEFGDIPFLNGGLFEPQCDDYYKFNEITQMSEFVNTVKIPKKWFENFFDVLETYNFTIDESMPFDVELSVDPEMLGRIFENLLAKINPQTGESTRHATGSYYTPRQIVDYMVDETLKRYLMDKTLIDEKEIEDLLTYHEDTIKMNEDEKAKIISAIDELKVIDPACGSGAFLMGTLQKLSWILHKVDPYAEKWKEKQAEKMVPAARRLFDEKTKGENEEFVRKLGIIENTIYGVDNQEIAVEIAKLRVFLSLIIDETVNNSKDNMGVKPLPNLEFKFACSDTLISLVKIPKIFGDDTDNIEKTKKLIEKYFISYGKEKENIKEEFIKTKDEIVKNIFVKDLESQMKALSSWDPFSSKASEWFDPEWMFGIKDGFDIVIGNPPYIQLQRDHGRLASRYEKQNFGTYTRMGDIYTLFYEKGIEFLKENGYLCFITSNKWMRAEYGKKLRKFLSKQNPLILIDLGPGIFESSTVDTNILLVQKSENKNQLKGVALKYKKDAKNLSKFVSRRAFSLPNVDENTWFIGNDAEIRLKEKIEKIGTPLKEWDVNIYRGILTGLNEAFIIDNETKERLCKEDPKSAEVLKPILRGRDIHKYYYELAGLWVIATFPALKLNIDDYPAVKKYLDQFLPKINQTGETYIDKNGQKQKTRKKTGNKWFETQDQIGYYAEFEKEKIVWAETAQEMKMAFVPKEIYLQKTCFMITGNNLKYIQAIANSFLLDWYIRQSVYKLGDKGIYLSDYFTERLLIPEIPESERKTFIDLVDKILAITKDNDYLQTPVKQAQAKEYEKQIDQLVYKLYGLTEDEIKIVERR